MKWSLADGRFLLTKENILNEKFIFCHAYRFLLTNNGNRYDNVLIYCKYLMRENL